MNAGVEIILERIKTNPEEFVSKGGGKIANGKWSRVLDNYSQHLNKEEYDAIKNAIDKVQQDYFTEEVMTILSEGADLASDEGKFLTSSIGMGGATQGGFTLNTNPQGHATWATTTATGTLSADSIMLGNTSINEATINQILQAHKEVRQKQTKPKHWWNKSLHEVFGKR